MRLLRWSLLFSIGILVWNVECLRVVGAAFSFDECPNGTKTTTSENNDDYYSPELDTPYNPFTDTRKPWREACPSIDVNHRGRYTSRLWPCVFSFHSTAVDERDPYTSSTACNNENQVLDHVVHEYVDAMVAVTSSEGEQLLKDEPPQDDDEEPIEAQVT